MSSVYSDPEFRNPNSKCYGGEIEKEPDGSLWRCASYVDHEGRERRYAYRSRHQWNLQTSIGN